MCPYSAVKGTTLLSSFLLQSPFLIEENGDIDKYEERDKNTFSNKVDVNK